MNNEAMKEVLNELFSHLERLETQSEAILQFLKEKKRVTDKQLAPYLEQAGNAANVKWRAARVRIDHLLSPEQPEKEIKLGKRPEVHEDPSSGSSSENKRSRSDVDDRRVDSSGEESTETDNQRQIESSDKDTNKIEPKGGEASGGGDLSKEEKPTTVETVQARPTDGKMEKPEEKSEVERKNAPTAAQGQDKEKSDSVYHPSEATAKQQSVEPAAQLESKEKKGDQEAA